LFFSSDLAGEITIAGKEGKKNIEAAKGIENMSENTEMDKKMKILNEIIKVIETILEIITNTEDKKDKKAEEISGNIKVIKKLCLLENLRKSIEMYKEDKSLEGK